MNAAEIILSGVVFVLFLGLWDAHNRMDHFGKWQRAALIGLHKNNSVKKWDELRGVIKNRDTTISMLNAQIKGLNFENEKYISQIATKDNYINELKGDLTKCKHDYACEVLGAKTETVKETLERWDGECPQCLGKGAYRKPYTKEDAQCENCKGSGLKKDFLDENLKDIPTENVNNNKQ